MNPILYDPRFSSSAAGSNNVLTVEKVFYADTSINSNFQTIKIIHNNYMIHLGC